MRETPNVPQRRDMGGDDDESQFDHAHLPIPALSSESMDMLALRQVAEALLPLFLHRLGRLVATRAVSAHLHARDNVVDAAQIVLSFIQSSAAYARMVEPGEQTTHKGQTYPLPPVILAEFGDADPMKPTVLVCGNYDVMDADLEDGNGWSSDPFQLRHDEIEGKVYGRGVSAAQGQFMIWLAAVEVFHRAEIDLPINLKIMLEGMGESQSECLQQVIHQEISPSRKISRTEPAFLIDVDYAIVCSGEWASDNAAGIVYGLRGLLLADLEVEGGSKTLNAGRYGGVVHEPVSDLVRLLASMSSVEGDVIVPGLDCSSVPPVSKAELDDVRDLAFDVRAVKRAAGNPGRLTGEDREAVMMNRCHFPALSIHGIESSIANAAQSQSSGPRRAIPNSAVAKISICLAHGHDSERALVALQNFLDKAFKSFESPNTLSVAGVGSDPWLVNPANELFESAAIAFSEVFGERGIPTNYIRDGTRSIAAVELDKQLADEVRVMVLPFGRPSDNQNSEDENMDTEHFLQATSAVMVLFDEIGKLAVTKKMVPRAKQQRKLFNRIKNAGGLLRF